MTKSLPEQAESVASISPVSNDGRPSSEAMGSRMRAGLAWKGASQATSLVSRTAMTVTLAHLISPREFGIAGMVLVFGGLILLLTDVGFSASLVQFKSLTEEDRSTAFWTGILVCTVFFAISVAISPYVAAFYHEPRVRWMFVAVSTSFLTGALITTQASLLWRQMDFRALEIRGIAATLLSATAAICAAVLGAGAWSLILQSLTFSAVSAVMIWSFSAWKPQFTFSMASLRRLGSFSTNVFFTRFLGYGDRNFDNLIVGRFLGPTALGVYSLGYSVILIPFDRLIWPIQSVFTPAFASVQDDLEKLRSLWLRATRMIVALMVPAMLGVIVVADDLVATVFGSRWMPVAAIMQILAWVALVQTPTVLNGPIYQSRNRTGLLLRVATLAFALDIGAFAVGIHWGVRGVAAAYALANTVAIVPLSVFLALRLLELPLRVVIGHLRGVLEAAAAMATVAVCARLLLVTVHAPAAARLAAVIVIGVAVYASVAWLRAREVIEELTPRRLRPLLSRRNPGNSVPDAAHADG